MDSRHRDGATPKIDVEDVYCVVVPAYDTDAYKTSSVRTVECGRVSFLETFTLYVARPCMPLAPRCHGVDSRRLG